jgi:hypothetical protein
VLPEGFLLVGRIILADGGEFKGVQFTDEMSGLCMDPDLKSFAEFDTSLYQKGVTDGHTAFLDGIGVTIPERTQHAISHTLAVNYLRNSGSRHSPSRR